MSVTSRARLGRVVAAVVCAATLASLDAQVTVQEPRPDPGRRGSPQPPKPGMPERVVPPPLRQERQGRLFPPLDLGLLEGPDREAWQKPDQIMDAMGIADGSVVADIGAGGGWFTMRLAQRVGPNGLVYAEDVQQEMVDAIRRRIERERVRNVRAVRGSATDPNLPRGQDAVLIVNSYHEMDDPEKPKDILTLLRRIADALKPQGTRS